MAVLNMRKTFWAYLYGLSMFVMIVLIVPFAAYSEDNVVRKSTNYQIAIEPKWNQVKRPQYDPELLQAKNEALKQWPKFLDAFKKKTKDQIFSVKTCLSDGAESEHVWISVQSVNGKIIIGKIDNDLNSVKGFHLGQPLQVQLNDIEDWVYYEGNESRGGFTIPILMRRANQH
jgi:uncharacterized protein YegJ (DUF2314 family)